jgi:N-succinyldiaminopimelate aminotransferase
MGTTIFAEMSALAVETGSVNLGQGFPDTDGPRAVAEAAARAILDGRGNQYPPGPGVPELRRAIADHQRRFYGLEYDPASEVLVTTGATEAIAAAMLGLVEPGDEVIAFEPYYDSYAASIAMAGGIRVPVTLRPPGFRPDIAALRALVTPRTRAILLNSPHNPTGAVFTRAEITAIARIAVEHDLLVITDEVYEHLVYAGEHVPIASLPGMPDRTVSISSAGKTFSFTGWKIGWVTGRPELVAAVRAAKQFLTYVSGGPFQYAIAEALAQPDSYFTGLRDDLRMKRDVLSGGLAELGFEVYPTDGTYFVMTDIRPLGETDGVEFCARLPERAGVVAIPSAVFYDDREAGRTQVRFTFCKRPEVLKEALARLTALHRRAHPRPICPLRRQEARWTTLSWCAPPRRSRASCRRRKVSRCTRSPPSTPRWDRSWRSARTAGSRRSTWPPRPGTAASRSSPSITTAARRSTSPAGLPRRHPGRAAYRANRHAAPLPRGDRSGRAGRRGGRDRGPVRGRGPAVADAARSRVHRRRSHRRSGPRRLRGLGPLGDGRRSARYPRRLPGPGRRRAGTVPYLPAGAGIRPVHRGPGHRVAMGARVHRLGRRVRRQVR